MSATQLEIPGFIDLQVNGFLGVGFSTPDLAKEDFARVCRALLERGTAAFLPTIITGPKEVFARNLSLMSEVMQEDEFQGRLPGLHVEGPFISPEPGAVGAHRPECVLEPDVDLFKEMQEWADGNIRLLTIAAEVNGAEELTRYAASNGVTVSIGHSLASDEDLSKAAAVGANALTHLGNGQPNLLPRHENIIWSGLANDDYTAMLIADGHHLPRPILTAMIRAKGIEKTVVVSDASPIAGMPPGRYRVLDNDAVLESSGLIYNYEKKCLVGSSATMLDCANHLATFDWLSTDDIVKLCFDNPLKLIGMDAGSVEGSGKISYDDAEKRFSC